VNTHSSQTLLRTLLCCTSSRTLRNRLSLPL